MATRTIPVHLRCVAYSWHRRRVTRGRDTRCGSLAQSDGYCHSPHEPEPIRELVGVVMKITPPEPGCWFCDCGTAPGHVHIARTA